MKLISDIDFQAIPGQVKTAIIYLLDTPRFIIEHKLWRGYFSNFWVFGFSLVAAYVFSTAVYDRVEEMITHKKADKVAQQNMEADEKIAEYTELLEATAVDSLIEVYKEEIEDLEYEKKNRSESLNEPMISGFLKFILLFILEIVIYFFSVKTNNILKHRKGEAEFSDFVKAQIRMVMVMIRNAIFAGIAWVALKFVFGITGLSILQDFAYQIVLAFYMGYAFLDNYLELFNIKISSSAPISRTHIGGALVIGGIASIFILVPLVGPLLIPIICSIAATRYAHNYKIENHPKVELIDSY